MTLFRSGQFKALWTRPNIILRYGSFDPAKRAIALAKAGNLGDAVRALASEGVLDPKDHIEKLKQLHPNAPLPADPSLSPPKSSLTQPFDEADFHLVVIKQCKVEEGCRRPGMEGWKDGPCEDPQQKRP